MKLEQRITDFIYKSQLYILKGKNNNYKKSLRTIKDYVLMCDSSDVQLTTIEYNIDTLNKSLKDEGLI